MESAQQWEKAVMQSPIPVVVEALAEWDANSQKLDSILTAKIKNFGGKIRLVRFDIEKLPDVAKALAVSPLSFPKPNLLELDQECADSFPCLKRQGS